MTGRSSLIHGGFAAGALSGLFGRRRGGAKSRRSPAARPFETLEGRTLMAVQIVSTDAAGMGGGASVVSDQPEVSDDGRFVVFTSAIPGVVAGVTEGDADPDVYIRNLADNTITGVSVNSGNVAFSGHSPTVSGDGRYVAFVTDVNLAAAGVDTNGQEDVYLWDRTTPGAFTLVSILANGTAGSGFQPSIGNDGRKVAFVSTTAASSFAAGVTDGNATRDVFHRNLDTAVTTLMSTAPGGTASGNARSDEPELSGDGNTVVFRSLATDLVAGVTDSNAIDDAFRRVLTNPNTEIVSIGAGSTAAGGERASVSNDGNLVAFESDTDLAGGGLSTTDIYVRNMTLGSYELVSTNAAGQPSTSNAVAPSITGDGTHVAFHSSATNLVTPDSAGADVFLKNRATGAIQRLSQTAAGEAANGGSTFPSVDLDGTTVGFISQATNLAPGTEAGEADDDVFAFTSGSFAPPDTTAPTAAVTAANVTTAGGTSHTVQVVYADNTGVNAATIDAADLAVTGTGGAAAVTGVTVTPAGNGTPLTATYTITPPGGTWDAADNGTYTVSLAAGAVTDTSNNPVAAGAGSFTVAIGTTPPPPTGGADLAVAAVVGGKKGLPPSVVGGTNKGVVRVQVTNPGDTPIAGVMQVALAARPSGQTTSALDVPIVTTPPRPIRLRPGQSRFIPVKFTYPAVTDGNYFLVATADAGNTVAEGNEGNNTGASATAVTIAAPFVDLEAAAIGAPPRGAITIGRRSSIPVTIRNLGNVPATGVLNISVYASTDGTVGTGDILLGTSSRPLRLKNGAQRVVRISGLIDPALPPGTYFIAAVVNSPAAITETSAANNTVVSATPFPAA